MVVIDLYSVVRNLNLLTVPSVKCYAQQMVAKTRVFTTRRAQKKSTHPTKQQRTTYLQQTGHRERQQCAGFFLQRCFLACVGKLRYKWEMRGKLQQSHAVEPSRVHIDRLELYQVAAPVTDTYQEFPTHFALSAQMESIWIQDTLIEILSVKRVRRESITS